MIIKPFNTLYIIVFCFFVAVLVIASVLLKDKPRTTKRKVLGYSLLITFVIYWIYKYGISLDMEYVELKKLAGIGDTEFSWWSELPLHLCNINLMMIPVACLTDNKRLYSFCFFCAPIGALCALLMPGVGFEEGYSLLIPRIMGYYFTHYMIFIGGIAILTFGLYKPRYIDIIPTAVTILVISFVIFIFNMLVRKTGLYPYCNYFYNVETDGNAILDIFYRLIPVPFVYQLGLFAILIPYMLLITTFVNLPEMIEAKKELKLDRY